MILDFQVGKDSLDLTGILRRGYGQADRFTAYVRSIQTAAGTVVKVDDNGDETGGFMAIALLKGQSGQAT